MTEDEVEMTEDEVEMTEDEDCFGDKSPRNDGTIEDWMQECFLMYSFALVSLLFNKFLAYSSSIVQSTLGLHIAISSPHSIAIFKKVEFNICLEGSPNEIFDTPNTTLLSGYIFFDILTAFNVS